MKGWARCSCHGKNVCGTCPIENNHPATDAGVVGRSRQSHLPLDCLDQFPLANAGPFSDPPACDCRASPRRNSSSASIPLTDQTRSIAETASLITPGDGLNQIPSIAIEVLKHRHSSVRLCPWFLDEVDAVALVFGMVAIKVVSFHE
jgi:hypothetical protein